ncbi:lipoprotein [Spiroplasma chrysopicola]|uniref:Lipoprotein n=1 Tax=Spiroplasma chrysopicola DF-1 TaxID=1276227 RepID=R4UID8_9MOLU|nr:lipoprotein [Spiroplasma chrysopicola]AGM25081.1 hypothetical protein SCHRY_v1c05030 [Spiroplasma chrysopicola DF-1]
MKKLLTILGVIGLTATTTTTVVACGTPNQAPVKKQQFDNDTINNLLSDMKYEIKDGFTHLVSEKADLDIQINETDQFMFIDNLLHNYMNGSHFYDGWVDVMSAIALSWQKLPSENDLINNTKWEFENQKWDYTNFYYILRDSIEIPSLDGMLPKISISWIIGVDDEAGYYSNLANLGLQTYFGHEFNHAKAEKAYKIPKNVILNREWFDTKIISWIVENFNRNNQDPETFTEFLKNYYTKFQVKKWDPSNSAAQFASLGVSVKYEGLQNDELYTSISLWLIQEDN